MIFPLVSSLSISPVNLNMTANVSVSTSTLVSFTNDFNYTIYNVSLKSSSDTNDVSFAQISELASAASISRAIQITPLTSYTAVKNLKFQFFYLTNQTIQPNIYNSNFTQTSFNPSQIILTKGSTVVWKNLDPSLGMPIRVSGNTVCSLVTPSNTCQNTFNDVGSFTISNSLTANQNVVIQSDLQQVLTTNPDNDKTVVLSLISQYPSSVLDVTLFDTNFSINWNQKKDGAVQIRNTGTQVIRNVTLSCGEWCSSFSKNNFDMSPGDSNYVIFTVAPVVFATADTNKTYSKSITISSLNSNSVGKSFSVFVPYSMFDISSNSTFGSEWYLEYQRRHLEFCLQFPTSIPECISKPIIIYANDTNSTGMNNFTFTTTQKDFLEQQTTVLTLKTDMNNLGKNVNFMADAYNQTASSSDTKLENINKTMTKQQTTIDGLYTFMWFQFIIFVFILTVVVGFFIVKYSKRKNISEVETNG
jgi:hypothetical protein